MRRFLRFLGDQATYAVVVAFLVAVVWNATPSTLFAASSNHQSAASSSPSGSAGGALGCTYPNPCIAGSSATTGLTPTPLSMTCMRTAAGLMMTAAASGTNFGITYTPATTALLIGTATASNSTADVATCDLVLPPWYIAGSNITLKVGCYYTDASSSASVHTMAADAYLNTNAGLQGATLIATAPQVCPITTSALQTFTITGATLVPGSLLTLRFSTAVTNAGGASTEFLTSASVN